MGHDAGARTIALWLSMVVLSVASPRQAEAVSEDEWQLGATGAYVWARVTGEGSSGALGGVELERGWRDGLAGLAGVDVVRVAGGRGAVLGALGGVYAIDVLRFVPFVELAAVAALVDGEAGGDGTQLGARVGVGLEYFIDRRWTVSPLVRCAWLPLSASGPGDDSLFVSVGVRVGHVFF